MGSKIDQLLSSALAGYLSKFLISAGGTVTIGALTQQALPTLISGIASLLVYLVPNSEANSNSQ